MVRRCLAVAAALAALAAGEETVGCFYHPFAAPTLLNPYNDAVYIYHDDNVTTWEKATNAVNCQERCFNQTNCSVFTFYADTGGCWLQGADAKLEISLNGDKYGAGTVAGPKVCPAVPDRCGPLSVPRPGFPETESQAWPENYQPRKLVCWKADRSTLQPDFQSCSDTVTVLQKVQDCTFSPLNIRGVPAFKTCKQVCEEDEQCAAYEVQNGICYNGLGVNCTVLPKDANSTGERLGRGRVRTVFEWAQKEFVVGDVTAADWTRKQFFTRVFGNSSFPSLEEAKVACKQICESNINCEFWQLSASEGCFVDTTDSYFQLAYPLTAAHFNGTNPSSIIAGAYIQHICGLPELTPRTSTMAPSADITTNVAHVTLEAVNLDYTLIPADKLPELTTMIQQQVAKAAGVASTLVSVELKKGVEQVKSRRLQGFPVTLSTLIETHIKVPAGRTVEGITASVRDNASLLPDLLSGTKAVLGEASPAIYPGLSFRSYQPAGGPTEAPAQTESSAGIPWWVWLLVVLGALLLIACLAAFALGACDEKKRKSKSSRRKKEAAALAAAEADRDVPLVAAPAPVPTVAEPVPMYVPAAAQAQSPVMYTSGAVAQPVFVSGAQPVFVSGASPAAFQGQPVYISGMSPARVP